jgi:hypothetical protein
MITDPTGGWAKAVERGSEAATEAIKAGRDAGGFLAPALRQLVGMAEDQFAFWRSMRRVRLFERYKDFMRERGLEAPTRTVDPAVLFPLVERASLERDDRLQDVWAMMLANASDTDSGAEMQTAFVSILADMTHLDVMILGNLAGVRDYAEFPHGLPTGMLPEGIAHGGQHRPSTDPVSVSLSNLTRLGCIEPIPALGAMSYARVWITALGKAFVAACTPRPPSAG